MKIEGLKKTYGDKTVLALPALEFERGRIYAVTGHNGSGKSTMAKLISGIEKADGELTFDGENLTKSGLKVCYLAQKPYAFNMSLKQNIKINLEGNFDERIDELVDKLKLRELAGQNAKKLSGGELQKMALARAMVKDYDIIILDEPTASMDEESTMLAEGLIKEYCEKTNAIVILITHEYDQTKRIADCEIHLDKGTISDR